jgi:hypothetical protein
VVGHNHPLHRLRVLIALLWVKFLRPHPSASVTWDINTFKPKFWPCWRHDIGLQLGMYCTTSIIQPYTQDMLVTEWQPPGISRRTFLQLETSQGVPESNKYYVGMKRPCKSIILLHLIFPCRVHYLTTWNTLGTANPNSRVHNLQTSHFTLPDLSHMFTSLMIGTRTVSALALAPTGVLFFGEYHQKKWQPGIWKYMTS